MYISSRKTRSRYENDIKGDLKIMTINNWTKRIQDRVKWKEAVEKAKIFK
jgi:hypothetical protein